MDLMDVGCDAGDSIALAENRNQWQAYVRAIIGSNPRVPLNPVN